ncbi:tRNA dihydrouridine(20/20a) synthase DusA [Ferrimonas lipolytica]|uniref:tRNA-dihydrouridine(20/20a) synthase n=1 Tax=Ferrimonas lipolytica TaxID=2724191 RepID=A0A6H1UHJ3_9GAMM|nr:tRNA dihydrouridine(20/20a) synthase DusA [Ferrimonas lipolytica]QIZ77783.1 tRNA dihydrouridine(20/20a) synthase DusA [Ferrimonas lipolytica]
MTYAASRFSVAPMLDWTDRHYRYMARLISKRTLLYTEMVTTGAIIHGKGDYLQFNEQEHPLALQLGGSNVQDLAHCAKLAQERGYDEVNLNVGCPSDRVQNGRFGACLMAEPKLVADCVKAMRDAVDIPVTVKTRIGIDEQDSYQFLTDFVGTVAAAGCNDFTIHARKAWLQGLSPKQNREIPELNYQRAYDIKRDFPQLDIGVNGGITTIEQCLAHLQHLDGTMVGREAYSNPWLLAQVDSKLFDERRALLSRAEVVEQMIPYVEAHIAQGGRPNHITRHMLGLFNGLPGGRRWRRHLAENAHKPGCTAQVLADALACLPEEALIA